MWPLVVAPLYGPRKLRQRQDWNAGDLCDLLHSAIASALGAARHKLQVIDDEQAEAALALLPAHPSRKLGNRDAAAVVDEQRQAGNLGGDFTKALQLFLIELAAEGGINGKPSARADHPGREL
jgi:hypothetical protein